MNVVPSVACRPVDLPARVDADVLEGALQRASRIDERGRTLLHHAAFLGDEAVTGLLIRWGASVHITDENSATPLHYAALGNHVGCLQLLLDAGSQVNVRSAHGRTALYLAARANCFDSCELLLKQTGIDINPVCINGNTPLFVAAREGHAKVVFSLLKAGADPYATNQLGQTPFHAAAAGGHIACLRWLALNNVLHNIDDELAEAERRGYPKLRDAIEQPDIEGSTALHLAAHNGHANVVSWLLCKGAYPTSKDFIGSTARDEAGAKQRSSCSGLILPPGDMRSFDLDHSGGGRLSSSPDIGVDAQPGKWKH
jgi:ankyrin repeat protein